MMWFTILPLEKNMLHVNYLACYSEASTFHDNIKQSKVMTCSSTRHSHNVFEDLFTHLTVCGMQLDRDSMGYLSSPNWVHPMTA